MSSTSSSLLAAPPRPLAPFLVPSALVHAAVFALVLGYSALNSPAVLDLNQKPIRATLVRQGTPRDEKLLPRIEEAPPPPVPVPVPVPAAVPEPVRPKPPPTKPVDERQKLLGAFDKVSKSAKRPEATGAVDGEGDSAQAEGDRYYGQLTTQVHRFYDVSETIPDQERIRLVAQVALFIDASGQLTRFRLVKSSGNDLFDGAVLAAVKRAAPFAPPPVHLRSALQRYGIVLQFRP